MPPEAELSYGWRALVASRFWSSAWLCRPVLGDSRVGEVGDLELSICFFPKLVRAPTLMSTMTAASSTGYGERQLGSAENAPPLTHPCSTTPA